MKKFLLALLLPSTVLGFSLSDGSPNEASPLEINAEKGLICSQDKKHCTALGPVVSTKGTSVLTCQKLVAYFQDAADKKAQSTASQTQDIKKIEAFGSVTFFDTQGGFKATGQYAHYTPAIGQLHLKGNPVLQDADTMVLAGSEVIFYENASMALTVGRSTIKRQDKIMQADILKIYFTKGADNKLVFDRLEADGNVVISTPTEIAKSKRGVYRAQTRIAELYDNVVLTRTDGQLRGNYARYDMASGQSQLFNNKGSTPSSRRVQAILNPKNLKKKKITDHGSN